MDDEAGFTLTEVLVGLIILGIFASLVSATLSGGFQAYRTINDTATEVDDAEGLQRALSVIGRQSFLVSENLQTDTQILTFETGATLSVRPEADKYKLLWIAETGSETVLETTQKLRLRVGQSNISSQQRRVGSTNFKKLLIVEENRGSDWVELASSPLVVTARSDCRFDIIGQRCR